jgi:hypothetical protein
VAFGIGEAQSGDAGLASSDVGVHIGFDEPLVQRLQFLVPQPDRENATQLIWQAAAHQVDRRTGIRRKLGPTFIGVDVRFSEGEHLPVESTGLLPRLRPQPQGFQPRRFL